MKSQLALVFDASQADSEKKKGMTLAAQRRKILLGKCREWAIEIAKVNGGICHADLVQERLISEGYHPSQLGNAAGSIFAEKHWHWTGERVRSERVTNHGTERKLWRYKPDDVS